MTTLGEDLTFKVQPPAKKILEISSGNVIRFYDGYADGETPFLTLTPDMVGEASLERLREWFERQHAYSQGSSA